MKVIVIGAGIVGLSTAYWLARDGHDVTVIDRNARVANGASYGNGGQLSYSYVAPLASPSVIASLPGWLTARVSPVKFRPAMDPAQLWWLLRFLAACNSRRSHATTLALLELAAFSRAMLHELIAAEPIDFAHRRNGKVVFYSTAASLDGARRQMDFQAKFGCEQMLLSTAECLELEPSLESAARRMSGALYTPSDETGDCRLLCEELQRVLSSRSKPVQFRLGTEVRSLVCTGRRLRGVALGDEIVETDLAILCSGGGTRALLAPIGTRLALYPIVGYSISPTLNPRARSPDKSITDYERRIVYARIGNVLRVAGFAEITGASLAVDPARIAALRGETAALFPGACALDDPRPWAGARPATPTSMPIIGGTRIDNLLVNVGQGALGFTLGLGSGRLIADIVAGRQAPIDKKAYAIQSRSDTVMAGASNPS